ncbi:MAG TPA: Gfo/Idh/MocA family oxidoreductase [Myxococcales bacterium]|nr:Gfo/Idh/MocA family oxidoreductase [Myxococcales bacterium]HIK85935.1 Gfo/Idh/MocA family oxidoreductase [Myxococcales bacterium]
MADPLRYGIIGTGMMGCEHIRNILEISNAVITGIADPNETSRRFGALACSASNEAPAVFEDYRDLLHSGKVDAVVIASPNFTHIDVMRDVFETDLHVLLEKPMCTTLEDCDEVRMAAESHSGVVWIGLEYRYMAPITALLEQLRAGAVGDLKMFSIREHRRPFLPKVGDWNRFSRNTGGTLVEKCCHFFDLMNLAVGSAPRRVYASGGQAVNHLDEVYAGETSDILDHAFVIVDYECGTKATLDLCMFAESSRNEQEICATGDAGKLECFVPGGSMVIGTRKMRDYREVEILPDPRVAHEGLHHGASYLEHLDFADAIRNGTPPLVDVGAGLASVELGIAAHRSIEEGQPVLMDELR